MGANPWRATLEDLRRRFAAAADPPMYVVRLDQPDDAARFETLEAVVRWAAGRAGPIRAIHGQAGPDDPGGTRPLYMFHGADRYEEFCTLATLAAAALAGPIAVDDVAEIRGMHGGRRIRRPPTPVEAARIRAAAQRDAYAHRWLDEVFRAAAAGGDGRGLVLTDLPAPDATGLSLDAFRASEITCDLLLGADPLAATLAILEPSPLGRKLVEFLAARPGRRATWAEIVEHMDGVKPGDELYYPCEATNRRRYHDARNRLEEGDAPLRLKADGTGAVVLCDKD
jgi:hypothetical protein